VTKCEWIIASLNDGWNEMAVRNGIQETRLPGPAKLLLLGLVNHNDGSPGRAVRVGVRRLADLASCNKDTAATWLRRLADDGWYDLTPAPANRSPEVSLARLPDALRERLVSEQRGHQQEEPCPNRGDTVSETEGHGTNATASDQAPPVSGLRGHGVRIGASGVRTEGTEEKKRSEEKEHSAHAPATPAPCTAGAPAASPRGRGRGAPGNGRPRGHRASSKVQAEDDRPESPHRLLRAHYDTEHERLRGAGPVFPRTKESRVGKAWKEILEVVDLDTARAVVTRALTDGYHVEPWQIADNVNRYRGPAPARPNGQRPRAHQPNAQEVPDYLRPKEPAP
jgi:hypothetical protein